MGETESVREKGGKRVAFLSDRKRILLLYRRELIEQFAGEEATPVLSIDSVARALQACFWICRPGVLVVSSNLRANVLFLLFWWRPGVVIVNGLGRWRSRKWAIATLRRLAGCNRRKTLVFQNFADFRFFQRSFERSQRSPRLRFVEGSGGVSRDHGNREGCFSVQRDSKIGCVAESLSSFAETIREPLTLVGVSQERVDEALAGHADMFRAVGYLSQEDLFQGDCFVQPAGYGEGFPHSLADALVSGLPAWIDRVLYVSLGLYRRELPVKYSEDRRWVLVGPTEELRRSLSQESINRTYSEIIRSCL